MWPRLPMSCKAVSIHERWGRRPMGLEWPGMECAKKQLLDHDIIRPAGCVPQPPDSVPPHMVSHVGLASAGQQLSSGGVIICLRQPL